MKDAPVSRAGFTLVELIASLTIVGLAVSVGAGTLAHLADAATHEDPQVSADLEQAGSRRFLADLLAGATVGTPSSPLSFSGIDRSAGPHADDVLVFHSTGAAPHVVGVAVVELLIDRDPATPERGLVVRMSPRSGAPRTVVGIAADAMSLEIGYLFPERADDIWLRGWISSAGLPAAVRLVAFSEDGAPYPLLGIPLLVPLGGV